MKKIEKKLIKIIEYLYSKESNQTNISGNILSELNIEHAEIQSILSTPSRHKNYIEWNSLTNMWYLRMKLTTKWIYYYEDIHRSFYKKVISHFQELNGFYTVIIAFAALLVSLISLYFSLNK